MQHCKGALICHVLFKYVSVFYQPFLKTKMDHNIIALGVQCADPENYIRGPENFLVNNVFHRRLYGPPSRSDWTLEVQLLLRGTVPVFRRKHIATCDFPGRGGGGGSRLPVPYGSPMCP